MIIQVEIETTRQLDEQEMQDLLFEIEDTVLMTPAVTGCHADAVMED